MSPEDERLVEQVTCAHRTRDRDGRIQSHPAWHDLDRDGRREAFEATVALRQMERALDPQGYTTTVKALLARIRSGNG